MTNKFKRIKFLLRVMYLKIRYPRYKFIVRKYSNLASIWYVSADGTETFKGNLHEVT